MFNWWFGKKRAKGDHVGPFRQPGRELTEEEVSAQQQSKAPTTSTRAEEARAQALATRNREHTQKLKNLLAGIEREAALGKLETVTTDEHTPMMAEALRAEGFKVEKRWPHNDAHKSVFTLKIKW